MSEPLLRIEHVAKSFTAPGGQRTEVLRDIEMELAPGEFVSVVGPSGSGKSTLFNVLAELVAPTSGSVRYTGPTTGGQPFSAYMPQEDLLFPWLTVEDNAALGLVLQGASKRDARGRVRGLLDTFRLGGRASSYPFELSGGMRQRVALLRTIVQDRPVLLLDEPFGALDYLTRTELQLWLADLCVRDGLSVILITHDVPEALFLSDRVHVLSNRPAVVRTVLEQAEPRPRPLSYMETDEFRRSELLLLEQLTQSASERSEVL
ncbi:ABC transporter ATP-binding protein [Curtobacterium sp. MCJR17_020]|uniref:ABC transporter ATP-binding protein n=1 Tax=Curtobacterium sp. MCJR17_020 TaxID=2175619 RepID=UPI000DA6DC0B|nr:ABC transporter ATP-binding protein [Curtobacterium sp. MCJR17_020]WIE70430.1 ABC transporter ATP-binding protein [Curtobacterium sp. MCJR17_020]